MGSAPAAWEERTCSQIRRQRSITSASPSWATTPVTAASVFTAACRTGTWIMSLKKNFKITERFAAEFQVVFTNFFNHDQFGDPSGDYLDTSNACWFRNAPWAGNQYQPSANSVWSSASTSNQLEVTRPGAMLPAFFCAPGDASEGIAIPRVDLLRSTILRGAIVKSRGPADAERWPSG